MTKTHLRVAGALLAGVTVFAALNVHAQDYPSRPVRVVVANNPGGVPDVLARAIGPKLSEALGQPVVIENRPGAGGIVAAESVLKSPADGHTVFIADTGNYAISAALFAKFPYVAERDFAPVILAAAPPIYLVANGNSPIQNLQDLVRTARSGQQIVYGSGGNGSVQHLGMELFKRMTGANLLHVPYKGASALAPALLSGDAPVGFIGYPIVAAHLKTGRLRVLAVSSTRRNSLTPDIPTMSEAGLPGYAFDISMGYLVPIATPRDVVLKLNTAINNAIKLPEVRQVMDRAGIPAIGGTPEEFGTAIRNEVRLMAEVVKASGAKVE